MEVELLDHLAGVGLHQEVTPPLHAASKPQSRFTCVLVAAATKPEIKSFGGVSIGQADGGE